MASLMDWLWILCHLGMLLGILPVQRTGNETKKVTFRYCSFPFFWGILIICTATSSVFFIVPLFYEYFDRFGLKLADRIGSYAMLAGGFGASLTYFSAQLSTARKIPVLLEELEAAWKGLEPAAGSTAAEASRRSFLFAILGCGCFYLADVCTVWVIVREFPHPVSYVTSVLLLVVEAWLLTLFLFVSLSCQVLQVILDERVRALRNSSKPLWKGEILAHYLETHLQVFHLCGRLSWAFHPTLFLSFLTHMVLTIMYGFFIISHAMRGLWLMTTMALAKTLFCDFLLFSLCRTADGLSSKAEEIIQTLTNDRTLSVDMESRDQVMYFESQTRIHQVKLQASGYFTLNKALLTSVASNMLTYMIVLLELRVE